MTTNGIEKTRDKETSLFAAFDNDLFVPRTAWDRVEAILAAKRGGNYGVTGPRGAGKTWLMSRAVSYAKEKSGLGLWFPSPSEYDPMAFLAALSEVTSGEYIRRYLKTDTESMYLQRRRQLRYITFGLLIASLIFLGYWMATSRQYFSTIDSELLTVPFMLSFVLYILAFASMMFRNRLARWGGPKKPEEELYNKAVELRTKARFTSALKSANETSASANIRGITGGLKRSRERALSERPATVSSMIHDFRNFSAELASRLPGPIVIAIDELDKMESANAVAALLRDTKGIFDVPGVHYFVSISDEAARYLNLGAIQQRNEFNSSFYQVFELAGFTPKQSIDMLKRRGVELDEDIASRLCILAGGVPREIVRLADLALSSDADENRVTSPKLEITLLKQETLALQLEIENSSNALEQADGRVTDEDKVESRLLARLTSDPERLTTTDLLSPRLWSPPWASNNWSARFGEQWRRLLVRMATAADLCKAPSTLDAIKVAQLQEVVSRTTTSAAVGRAMLLELKQSPVVEILTTPEQQSTDDSWQRLRRLLGLK